MIALCSSWFFDALFSKHHPCTLRIPDTVSTTLLPSILLPLIVALQLVLVTGESRHLLRCDSKAKICTVPRPSVNHFIETIAERYPCGGADYTGLVVVIHAEGKTPQMLTIPVPPETAAVLTPILRTLRWLHSPLLTPHSHRSTAPCAHGHSGLRAAAAQPTILRLTAELSYALSTDSVQTCSWHAAPRGE